jgi:cytochrome c-type biogenesis protein
MEGSNITILIAFAAGLLSFLTPCVLPLVPGYISLMSGVSVERLKGEGEGARSSAWGAVVSNSLAFNAGVSVIFMLLGATAGWVGNVLFSTPWVRIVGGLVIIAFGLQMMGVLKIGALYRDTRKFSDDKPRGPLGSALLGVAFAAGWTPCIGPILGGIIGLAATSPAVPRRRAGDELVPGLLLALPPPPAQGRGRLGRAAHRHRPDGRLQQPDVGRVGRVALPAERREPRES